MGYIPKNIYRKKYPNSLMHIDDYSKKMSEEELINSSEMKVSAN